jgi:transposase
LPALAAICDGGSRGEAAELAGVGLQTVRDWVLRFNAEGPDGLVNRKAPGKPPLLNQAQRRELAAVIERGPIPAVDGVVRWRLIDLTQWLYATYGIATSKQTLSRILRAIGYRKLSARPRHHAQDPEAVAVFKNVWPAPSARVSTNGLIQSALTYPVSGFNPGQDGEPRTLVLIKLPASERHF